MFIHTDSYYGPIYSGMTAEITVGSVLATATPVVTSI